MATIRTKYYFAEQIMKKVASGDRPRDEKLEAEEVILEMDQVLCELANQNFTENFTLFQTMDVNEMYLFRPDPITITDNNAGSRITLPARYADLPGQLGIYECYLNNKRRDRIIIRKPRSVRRNSFTMAGPMEQRLWGYPQGLQLIFSVNDLSKICKTVNVALIVTDSSQISDDAVYPVPPNKEALFIQTVYEKMMGQTSVPEDNVNDSVKQR
jgi:hypothetical protein